MTMEFAFNHLSLNKIKEFIDKALTFSHLNPNKVKDFLAATFTIVIMGFTLVVIFKGNNYFITLFIMAGNHYIAIFTIVIDNPYTAKVTAIDLQKRSSVINYMVIMVKVK